MNTNMNMAITIFGFVLSALFIMVICCRLLCSHFRQRSIPLDLFQIDATHGMMERSIHGMEPSIVSSFPTIKFNQHIFISSEDNLCTICLGDYKEREILRILPRCGHAFHIACIDMWLRQHHTCPVCRISLQVFSEWRQIAVPLLSLAAKARFVLGALPDHLFEQPEDGHNVSVGIPSGKPKESLGGGAVAGTDGEVLEAGESSGLRRQISQRLGKCGVKSRDRQQLLDPRVDVGSDALSHCIACGLPVDSGDRQQLLEPGGKMDSDALSHYDALEQPGSMMHGTSYGGCIPDAPKEGSSSETELPSCTNADAAASSAGRHAGGTKGNVPSASIP